MKFEVAVHIILGHEGGYVHDINDPGGETKYGISKRAFPKMNIRDLTVNEAKNIYRNYYWTVCSCDQLPDWARLIVFDCAVNQGPQRASMYLQRCVGVKADGVIGPHTLAAMACADPLDFIYDYAMQRHHSYAQNPRFNFYGAGWTKRLLDITIKSLSHMVGQPEVNQPIT